MKINKIKIFKFKILFLIFFLSFVLFFPKLRSLIGNKSLNNNSASQFLIFINKIDSSITNTFLSFLNYFRTKNYLISEINSLESKINEQNINGVVNYNMLLTNNLNSRNESSKLIVASKIFSDWTSIYDSLILNRGSKDGVAIGDLVFINQNQIIGEVSEISLNTSVVTLFSKNKEKIEGVLKVSQDKDTSDFSDLNYSKNSTTTNNLNSSSSSSTLALSTKNKFNLNNVLIDLYGYGGGDFFSDIPANLEVELGTIVYLANNDDKVIGEVVNIEKKDASYYQRLLIRGYYNLRINNNYFIFKN